MRFLLSIAYCLLPTASRPCCLLPCCLLCCRYRIEGGRIVALACKVCSAEVEALSGRRCHKCRQLVCVNCVEPDTLDAEEGVTCIVCTAQAASLARHAQAEQAAASVSAPASGIAGEGASGSPLIVPTWAWVAFGLLLSTLFGLIVYYPTYQLRALEADILGNEPGRAKQAAEDLASLGTDSALAVLVEILQTAPQHARITAARGLARFPDPKALTALEDASLDPELPPKLRAAVEEGLVRHQSLFPAQKRPDSPPADE